MKAKEYAEIIISKTHELTERYKEMVFENDADFAISFRREATQIACDVGILLFNAMCEEVDKKKNEQAKLGVYREALTKWKAIVTRVYDVYPLHPVTDNIFGLMIVMQNPEAFEYLVANKVFLGYDFTEKEKSILEEIKAKRAEYIESMREHKAKREADTFYRLMILGIINKNL